MYSMFKSATIEKFVAVGVLLASLSQVACAACNKRVRLEIKQRGFNVMDSNYRELDWDIVDADGNSYKFDSYSFELSNRNPSKIKSDSRNLCTGKQYYFYLKDTPSIPWGEKERSIRLAYDGQVIFEDGAFVNQVYEPTEFGSLLIVPFILPTNDLPMESPVCDDEYDAKIEIDNFEGETTTWSVVRVTPSEDLESLVGKEEIVAEGIVGNGFSALVRLCRGNDYYLEIETTTLPTFDGSYRITVDGSEIISGSGFELVDFQPFFVPSLTPSPTASPTEGPTASPTEGPTASPTEGPTAGPTQTHFICVNDPDFRLGGVKAKSCEWVAKKNIDERCKKPGVFAACPETCNPTCAAVVDCTDDQDFQLNGLKGKNCEWVAKQKTDERCKKTGVMASCRRTCNPKCGCRDSIDEFQFQGSIITCMDLDIINCDVEPTPSSDEFTLAQLMQLQELLDQRLDAIEDAVVEEGSKTLNEVGDRETFRDLCPNKCKKCV